MNRKTIGWARLAMATCAVVAVMGCDNSESAYLDQQSNAVSVRLAGGSGTDVSAAVTTATDGSLPVNIQTNQLLAQSRLSDARALADSLRIAQSSADSLVARISSLTSLAGVADTIGMTYRKMEPTASIALIKDLSAKARGDGNVEKFSDLPNGSIPTLAAVKQEKSRLEGELAKAQGDLQSATAKRDALLKQVGVLSAKSDEQRGQTRVDTVTQSADLRQQAALISRTISQLDEQISRLTADLSVQAMLETQLGSAVKSFDSQQQSIESGWKETKVKIDAQGELARSILTSDAGESGQSSVKALAADLNAMLKDVDAKREETLKAFDESVSKFTAAETGANSFSTALSTLRSGGSNQAESAAWTSLSSTLNAQNYILHKSIALREQAAVHTSHAQSLLQMARVAESLETLPETLNAPVPEPFNSQNLKKQASDAISKADELLTDAISRATGVSGTDDGFKSIVGLKYSTLIFLNYDRALLSQLASAAGLGLDVAKQSTHDESIAAAKTAIAEAREASAVVPSVPSEIYVEPPVVVEEKPAETTPATETAAADSPVVAEVRQSLTELLNQQSDATDGAAAMEQFFARVKSDETTQPTVDALKASGQANLKLEASVKAKFGDEGAAAMKEAANAAAGGMGKEKLLSTIASAAITAADDTHAEIALPMPVSVFLPSLKLVKEEEIWKLDLTQLPEAVKPQLDQAIVAITARTEKVNQFAADVDAGKYATIDDLKAALPSLSEGMNPAAPAATDAPAAEAPAPEGAQPAEANPTDGVAPGM